MTLADPSVLTPADVESDAQLPPRVTLRSGIGVSRFYATYALGAGFPAFTGVMLYGWRALAMLAVILPATLLSLLVWRRIGSRGKQIHIGHGVWLAMLLWLMLPAHLLGTYPGTRIQLWPIPLAASLLL